MNDADKTREPKAPKPATAIASHRVHPDKTAQYIEAQKAITDAARRSPGFVGTEVLSPVAGLQEEWVAIFRLESNEAMKQWLESAKRGKLMERIENSLLEPSRMLILASDDSAEPPVAMVFTHRVADDKVPAYLGWRRKAIAAQAHYPGYLATEFFEPHGKMDEWVDVVRYDSLKDLEHWMESKERRDLLEELDGVVESRHAHRVTGLEGWFAMNRPGETASAPPSWKQALAVLRAVSNRDGTHLPQPAVAAPIAVSSDAVRKYPFGCIADLAGDACGEPPARFLAVVDRKELEDGSAGDWHRRGGARVVCVRVSNDHLETPADALCQQTVTLRMTDVCCMRS